MDSVSFYLHLLPLVHQKEAAHLLQLGLQGLHLRLGRSHAVIPGGVGGRVRGQRVLPLVDPAVGALLAVQTQVDLATLAAHRRPEPPAAVPFARVTERNVARRDPNPVVVPHPLLAMELQFAAGALQAAAFVALERRLVRTPAGVVLLAARGRARPLTCGCTLTTHREAPPVSGRVTPRQAGTTLDCDRRKQNCDALSVTRCDVTLTFMLKFSKDKKKLNSLRGKTWQTC